MSAKKLYEQELDALILFQQAQKAFLKACGWEEVEHGWKPPQDYFNTRVRGSTLAIGHAVNSQIYWLHNFRRYRG